MPHLAFWELCFLPRASCPAQGFSDHEHLGRSVSVLIPFTAPTIHYAGGGCARTKCHAAFYCAEDKQR